MILGRNLFGRSLLGREAPIALYFVVSFGQVQASSFSPTYLWPFSPVAFAHVQSFAAPMNYVINVSAAFAQSQSVFGTIAWPVFFTIGFSLSQTLSASMAYIIRFSPAFSHAQSLVAPMRFAFAASFAQVQSAAATMRLVQAFVASFTIVQTVGSSISIKRALAVNFQQSQMLATPVWFVVHFIITQNITGWLDKKNYDDNRVSSKILRDIQQPFLGGQITTIPVSGPYVSPDYVTSTYVG